MSDLNPHAINALWTRVQMEKSRLLARGDKLCDLCHDAVPTDRHHIYTKYSTMSNVYARELADSEELSALLCRDCHAIADSAESRNQLFLELYRIYGYARINDLHQEMDDVYTTGASFNLPSED